MPEDPKSQPPPGATTPPDQEAIQHWLSARLAEQLGVATGDIDANEPLTSYGIGSAEAVSLSGELEEWLGRNIRATVAYDYPTIEELSRYLAGETRAEPERGRAPTAPAPESEAIAIIGVGCRFPGARDTRAFWQLLLDGTDAISEVPRERWDVDRFYDADPRKPGRMSTRWGGFLDRIDGFDCSFFGISPREASRMDPQQRLLLEVAWEALEDSGQAPDRLAGTRTGVFVGISSNDYGQLQFNDDSLSDAYAGTGNALSLAANRVSYVFDFHGPSLAVDTACSSSLVATHLACQSLGRGECAMALVGGVNVILSPMITVNFTKAGFMAPDGRCKSFDARADGYVRGEGAGVVVLKPLGSALHDGDPVYAVIRGSAVNQDGRTNGITAPNGPAQSRVLREAYRAARMSPGEVQYVEAHGTGTSLGDPIEAAALGEVMAEGRAGGSCAVGSVKTNIGHLEAAAGIAGLIKVALSLHHRTIPPSLHFKEPNPHIAFDDLSLHVQTERTAWPDTARAAAAGVSSFGFGGTNAHVALTAAPEPAPGRPVLHRPVHLLCLSARTEPALADLTRGYGKFLETDAPAPAAEVCFTASAGRSHFEYRRAVPGASSAELGAKLQRLAAGEPATGAYEGRASRSTHEPRVAFLFTGQGSQYPGMGRALYESAPVFRDAVDRCAGVLRAHGVPLIDLLYPGPDGQSPASGTALDQTRYTQPVLFSLEYALVELWRSWGIVPGMVLGHSVGEYAAACVAGAMDLEDGLTLIAHRGRLMQELSQPGAMAAVFAAEEAVEEALEGQAGRASVAAVNGPQHTVIAGADATIAAVLEQLASRGIAARPLQVSHAFHSPLMDPVLQDFERVANDFPFEKPRLALVSNVTGRVIDHVDAAYWREHLRAPVRFRAGMETLRDAGCEVFVEMGPGTTLSAMGRRCVEGGRWLASLRPGRADWQEMLESLGQMYVWGMEVDWEALNRPYSNRKVALPHYPFQRQRTWFEALDRTGAGAARPMREEGAAPSVVDLLNEGNAETLARQIELSGPLTEDQRKQLRPLLEILIRQHRKDRGFKGNIVHDYYDSLAKDEGVEEEGTPYLTFGLFPDIVPGFSWVGALTGPADPAGFRELALSAQKELRRLLFDNIDFARCSKVLDFGCGYASDMVDLAETNPHLRLTGYTLSGEQARIGNERIRRRQLQGRIRILNRDSAHDAFPDTYDLIFGFEVASHIADKTALFANIGNHLKPGGLLVMADFVSNLDSSIDHEKTSSYIVTKAEWVGQLSSHGLRILEAIDVSQEVGNFLFDPDFDEAFAALCRRDPDESIAQSFRSYDNLGTLLRTGQASYVLFRTEKRADASEPAAREWNRDQLSPVPCYSQKVLDRWFYELKWAARPRPGPAGSRLDRGPAPSTWLILTDAAGIAASLVRRLEAAGHRCILIRPGTETRRIDAVHYEVEATRTDGFARLLRETCSDTLPLGGIVHLWSVAHGPDAEASTGRLATALELGCGSALALAQALVAAGGGLAAPLWLVTRGSQSVQTTAAPHPEQAALWGLGRVISIEHPALDCRLVDLDPAATSQEAAESLRAELCLDDTEDQAAYRQEKRHVARLERAPAAGEAGHGLPIRSDATYLVTGGLGALGLRIASWLVEKGAHHLALAGRSNPSHEARTVIDRLQQKGARVLVSRTDVSREDEVAAVLQRIRDGFPPLSGVVHAAGVVNEGALAEQSWTEFASGMAAKAHGAWNLHRLTQPGKLDFFVCFSSIAAILSSPRLGSYAASNAFLDALMQHRNQSGLTGLSVNWGPWAEAGMATEGDGLARMKQQGISGIPTAEGLEALERLLSGPAAQMMVVPVDWRRFAPLFGARRGGSLLEALNPPGWHQGEIADAQASSLRAEWSQGDARERRHFLERHVDNQIARVLHLGDSELDPGRDLVEYGLDSIMVMELAHQFSGDFQLTLYPREIFNLRTARELAHHLETRLLDTAPASAEGDSLAGPVAESSGIPLSFSQERLWFLDRLNPGTPLYNVALGVQLEGRLDLARLTRSFEAIVERHEALRTTFSEVNEQPVQVIHPTSALAPSVVVLEALPAGLAEAEAERIARQEAQRPFDLGRGPLIRLVLIKVRQESCFGLLVMHHIVTDAWSMSILIGELMALYGEYARGKPASLKPLPIQYADFARWQRGWMQGEMLEQQLSYWKQQLEGAPPLLQFPTDRPRPSQQTFGGARQWFVLEPPVRDALIGLGRQEGATLFMTLLTAFNALLYRTTGQQDLVVGTAVANRDRSETRELIGFFVNLLALRTRITDSSSFRDLLKRVRRTTLEAYDHQSVPFTRVVEALRPERDPGHAPIVQGLFVLQNVPIKVLELPDLRVQPVRFDPGITRFDLALFMTETPEGLAGEWHYRTDLFDAATIGRLTRSLTQLLDDILVRPDSPMTTLEFRTGNEKDRRSKLETARPKRNRRRGIDVSKLEVVRTGHLDADSRLPLVVRPAAQDVDLVDWAGSNRELIENQLLRHGAILFRDFDIASVADFERFALSVCPDLFGDYGDLPREGTGKIYESTPYPEDRTIRFHNESSHTGTWPLKQWFHCVQPAASGGETPIVDCREVLRHMKPATREPFERKKLVYVRNFTDGLDVSWQEFFDTTARATVERLCREAEVDFEWRSDGGLRTRQSATAVSEHPVTGEGVWFNQLQHWHPACLDPDTRQSLLEVFGEADLPRNCYFGDGSRIDDSVMEEIGELYWKLSASFPWQARDILMVDNMLVAHAGNPYSGERKIVVALGEMIHHGTVGTRKPE